MYQALHMGLEQVTYKYPIFQEREEEKKNHYVVSASCVSETVLRTPSNPNTLRSRYYLHSHIRNVKLRKSD